MVCSLYLENNFYLLHFDQNWLYSIHFANKKPMGHIANLRNSSNQKAYLRKAIFKSIKREKKNISLRLLCDKFGWNWPIGPREDEKCEKFIDKRRDNGQHAFRKAKNLKMMDNVSSSSLFNFTHVNLTYIPHKWDCIVM